jgi:LacI family transcriptional regulator
VQALTNLCPKLTIIPISGGRGRGPETARLVKDSIAMLGNLRAVYSMGGGNRSIVEVLADARIQPSVFIAHDLDQENRALINAGDLSFIMHHDLRADLNKVFQAFLTHHKLTRQLPDSAKSDIHIITPFNLPSPR